MLKLQLYKKGIIVTFSIILFGILGYFSYNYYAWKKLPSAQTISGTYLCPSCEPSSASLGHDQYLRTSDGAYYALTFFISSVFDPPKDKNIHNGEQVRVSGLLDLKKDFKPDVWRNLVAHSNGWQDYPIQGIIDASSMWRPSGEIN